jgi:hypothetical protein
LINHNGFLAAAAKGQFVHWPASNRVEKLKLCKDSRGREVIMAAPCSFRGFYIYRLSLGPWHVVHTRTGSKKLRNRWNCHLVDERKARRIWLETTAD